MFVPGKCPYLAWKIEQGGLKRHTIYEHRKNLKRYILPFWGDYNLADLHEVEIENKLRSLRIAGSTKNSILNTLNIVLKEAKRARKIRQLPAFHRFARSSTKPAILTSQEIADLFPDDEQELAKIWRENAKDSYGLMFWIMFRVVLHAGLRPGEGRALSFEQVYSKQNTILIDRQINSVGRQFEGDELKPFIQDSLQTAKRAGILKKEFRTATLLADTNYFSEANCRYVLQKQKLKAVIPDPQFRRRDPGFATQKPKGSNKLHKFREQDFFYDPIRKEYRCPKGKILTYYSKSTTGQYRGRKYGSRRGECAECAFLDSCFGKGACRRYLFVVDKGKPKPYTQRMIEIVDSPAGRQAYAQRMGIVEPVFGNIKNNKRMNRFTLRGLPKVTVQWLYYCLVHNIEKITTTGAINRLVME